MARERELILRQSQDLYSQLLANPQNFDPETLLKRDCKTGASRIDEKVIEQLFNSKKYDERQNILLAKNPLIIRKEKVSNQNEFQLDTLKAIIEIIGKKSVSDQMVQGSFPSQF